MPTSNTTSTTTSAFSSRCVRDAQRSCSARARQDGQSWKIRHFTDQVVVSQVMNLGHRVLHRLFNVVYGTRLRDPFTMFKVFRRDCLHGLTFESNRFDFDWELVGKLVRRATDQSRFPSTTIAIVRTGKEGLVLS